MVFLVVEDEQSIFQIIRSYLENRGHIVVWADDGLRGLELFRHANPGFIVLDIMLPSMDGFQLCKEIRKLSDVPIIMLTAKGELEDRILGLSSGADDYLSKPFSPRELLERIDAILRRCSKAQAQLPTSGIVVRAEARSVIVDGIPVELTYSEFEILKTLHDQPEKVFTRDELISIVKGSDSYIVDRGIDVHIANLRKKIGSDPRNPKYIRTIWGVGYRL